MHVLAVAYLTGGIGREAVIGKVLNLALQAGDSSSGAATDMVLANWAIPDKSSLACLCSLFPANRDNSCIAVSQVTALLVQSRAMLWDPWISRRILRSSRRHGTCDLDHL